jgi:hypothetical protein
MEEELNVIGDKVRLILTKDLNIKYVPEWYKKCKQWAKNKYVQPFWQNCWKN